MTTTEEQEVGLVLSRVAHWPADLRVTLARRILETVETPKTSRNGPGYTAAEAIAIVNSRQPAPDDATVERWMGERDEE